MTLNSDTIDRAFVLGIDGVPWDLIHEWIAAGELPNFGTLLGEGVGAPLESTTPPTTPLAWPSIATGVWPDKHGIYGFKRVESDYTQEMYTSAALDRPPLWELLSPATVGNVPMTYPASELDGTMVSGMISPSMNYRFTHPPEFVDELTGRIPEYQIGLNWYDYADEKDAFTEDLASLVAARRSLMDQLMEIDDWRLFFFVYTAPDRLQHLIWEEDVILEHYKQLDDILGDVLEYVDRHEANLFVVSDHGFGLISKFVHLNTVLANEGYLTRKGARGTRNSLERLGITKSTLHETFQRLGIDDKRLAKHLPKQLVDGVAKQVPGDHSLYDVDFSETVAFAYGPSYVYINDTERFDQGIVSPSDIPSIKRDLQALFSNVTDPDTGERALDVHDGDDVFPTDEASPDLVVVGKDGYEEKMTIDTDVFAPAGAKAASHRKHGVFFARGPDIRARDSIDGLSVVDVAPTVLHSVGEAIPDDVDGEVQTEIVASDAEPSVRKAESARQSGSATDETVDEDFGDVEDRLRGLGYME
ncbi:alkaline phosphatase family protein [Natronorubrum aibiense]|uniref:Phosphodiesterase n=1 Tax=Natronorubrum aibiense TaxID=348826 RepID=A0A5P9PA60_9EURY|nr:alkaline phosphatase family protein [Natronorubrum aibiense]QFU85015.1 phosphodiesterase [Natronorubrum aibiense]